MSRPINFETHACAVGVVKGLRGHAQQITELIPRMPEDLAREYGALVLRALSVTEETTWGELVDIYQTYLQMTARWGISSSNNTVN